MDKKRFKAALVVLDAVKSRFPQTKEFIDDTLKDKCEKEKITADEVISYKFRSKELAWRNIFVLNLYYSDYFLFIGVERCGRQQEDKTAIKTRNKKAIVRINYHKLRCRI